MITQLRNTITQGDCLHVMQTLPDKSVDLVLCDLPYGITDNPWDTVIPYGHLWREYRRLVKPTGYVILTSLGLFTSALMESNRKQFSHKIIWVKPAIRGFFNANRMPLHKYEEIIVFRMGKGSTYNPQFTFGHKAYKGTMSTNYSRIHHKPDYAPQSDGRRYPVDVLEFPASPFDACHIHPTQKPVEMGRYLIRQYSNPGDIVLDNCCGSGSFLLAATLEGRPFVGIDSNPDYVAAARKRIAVVQPIP